MRYQGWSGLVAEKFVCSRGLKAYRSDVVIVELKIIPSPEVQFVRHDVIAAVVVGLTPPGQVEYALKKSANGMLFRKISLFAPLFPLRHLRVPHSGPRSEPLPQVIPCSKMPGMLPV